MLPRRTALPIPLGVRRLAWLACLASCACSEDAITLGTQQPAGNGFAVESILLRQAKNAELIGNLGTNTSFSLASLPSNEVSLEAVVTGSVVSVEFVVDSKVQVQEVPPFTYPGDINGQLMAFMAVLGAHSVTATPYSQAGAQGQRGTSLSKVFTFVE